MSRLVLRVLTLSLLASASTALAHGDDVDAPLTSTISAAFPVETWRLACPFPSTKFFARVCPRPGGTFPARQPFSIMVVDVATGETRLVQNLTGVGCTQVRLAFHSGRAQTVYLLVTRPGRGAGFRYTTVQQCWETEDAVVPHATRDHALVFDR